MKKNNKKTKEIAVSKTSIERWGNIYSSKGLQEETRKFCSLVASVYEIPPSGVVAMGNQPYINKEGRLYLLNDLRKPQHFKTEFFQVSYKPEDYAVCKKTIIFEDGTTSEAVGEANRSSVKLEAVKHTLNMMAETRALNRAIWQNIAGDVWKRALANLQEQGLDEEAKEKVMEAGRVSAEEVNREDSKKKENEEVFEQLKKGLEQNRNKMSEEEKVDTMDRINDSDVFSKKQKDQLSKMLV
jgi:hypothetical protein